MTVALDRAGFVGGSDVAAIVGLSPWKTAAGVWLEKTGRASDDTDSDVLIWGRRLEQAIIDAYAADTPLTVHPWGDTDPLVCDDAFWHRATPDAVVSDDALWVGGLEVKTTSAWNAHHWDDGPPVHYQIQCQWYMHVTGVAWWDVAVLIGGNDYRTYRLERDDDAIGRLVVAVDTFWTEHIETDTPPPVTGPDSTFRFVAATAGETAQVDAGAVEAAAAYREAANRLTVAQAAKDEAADRLRQALGAAVEGYGPDGRLVATWKPVTARRFDEKTFAADHPHLHAQYMADRTYRRLHVPKEEETP